MSSWGQEKLADSKKKKKPRKNTINDVFFFAFFRKSPQITGGVNNSYKESERCKHIRCSKHWSQHVSLFPYAHVM